LRTRNLRHHVAIGNDVSASEAGEYVFCAKAWHLEHVVGSHPSNEAQELRRSGTVAHLAHAIGIREAHRVAVLVSRVIVGLLAISLVLLMLGIVLLEQ
jgi:hypothetical protein